MYMNIQNIENLPSLYLQYIHEFWFTKACDLPNAKNPMKQN